MKGRGCAKQVFRLTEICKIYLGKDTDLYEAFMNFERKL